MGDELKDAVRLDLTGWGSGAGHDKIAHRVSATKGIS
jgi:hypothetical protein